MATLWSNIKMNKILILAILAITACNNNDSMAPPRLKFQSTIGTRPCSNGNKEVLVNWQVTGVWKATFIRNDIPVASLENEAVMKGSGCSFYKAGNTAYVILNSPNYEGDMTQIITVP